MTLTPTDDTALPSALTDPTLVDEPWVDTKRRQWAWGLVVPAIPLISVALWAATGGEAWLVTMPILMYIVLPLVDARVGEDTANPPESAVAQLEAQPVFVSESVVIASGRAAPGQPVAVCLGKRGLGRATAHLCRRRMNNLKGDASMPGPIGWSNRPFRARMRLMARTGAGFSW